MKKRILSKHYHELTDAVMTQVQGNFDLLGISKDQHYFEAVREGVKATLGMLDAEYLKEGLLCPEALSKLSKHKKVA